MLRMSVVDESRRLLTIHLLLEMTMEECVGDVHLVHRPCARDCELKDSANRPGLDNRGECIREINASTLSEASDHPTSFIAVECAVGVKLVLKHPLPGNDVGVPGTGNKLPSRV